MPTDLLYGLLPEHLLLGLLVLLMIIEITGKGRVAAGFLFILAAGVGAAVLSTQLQAGYSAAVVPGEIVVDSFSLMGRTVVLTCGAIYALSCLGKNNSPKFWMLLSSSLLGASIILLSSGFIPLFLGIEMLSLPAFALIVHRAGSSAATEGAFKYLLLSAVASAMILFGISLAYGSTQSLVITEFAASISTAGGLSFVAAILILCGFFLKAAVFPFHGWAPDAYSGARLQVTTFLASIVKGTVVLGLVRIFGEASLGTDLTLMIMVFAIVSIFYGNVTAIRQATFKRLLAYSSIAHAGYMIFALADSTGACSNALLWYVAIYALTTIVACTCFNMLTEGDADDLESLEGAFAVRPIPSVILALAVLSMAGIPPLPGFYAKFLVFKATVSSGHLWPSVIALVGSFVGVTYYLGIAARLFNKGSFEPEADSSSSSV